MPHVSAPVYFVSEEVNDKLVPPTGWYVPEEVVEEQQMVANEAATERMVINNLPFATEISENVVNAIERRTDIKIPESYLRVEADTKFHVVLLVDNEAYLSPEIVIANIIADEYSVKEKRFDIRFTFSVLTEFLKKCTLYPGIYKLKHEHAS